MYTPMIIKFPWQQQIQTQSSLVCDSTSPVLQYTQGILNIAEQYPSQHSTEVANRSTSVVDT